MSPARGETSEGGLMEGQGQGQTPEEKSGIVHSLPIGSREGNFLFVVNAVSSPMGNMGEFLSPGHCPLLLKTPVTSVGLVYGMGTIVFSSFSSLSPALLPVYFSHYMFVQYSAQ